MNNGLSLPTIVQDQYQLERSTNDTNATRLFAKLFPDTPVSYAGVFNLISILGETKVNPEILSEVAMGIHNVRNNVRKGQIIVHVTPELSNVQIRQNNDIISTTIDEDDSEDLGK